MQATKFARAHKTIPLDTADKPWHGAVAVLQMSTLVNLLDFDLPGLTRYFESLGEKPFRALQIFQAIHQRGLDSFEAMTDLSQGLRARLTQDCCVQAPIVASEQQSRDGTVKWLLKLADHNHIEMVFIPERRRGTLCISSQVGCILNCSFCSTGKQGFSRNLSVFEIIGKLWQARHRLKMLDDPEHPRAISNIVMMGMGEPLLNFDALIAALSIMRHDKAYALSKRRVTVSTAGVVPEIDRLSSLIDVSLAVSLHAPSNDLRDQIVPLNKKYPIEPLMAACHRYVQARPGRHVTIEYVMLKGVNDSLAQARALATRLQGLAAKVNLIPFNPFFGSDYVCSTPETIEAFKQVLHRAGCFTTVRRTRGDDIDAACGQLVGRVLDRTYRQQRFLAKRSESMRAIPLQVDASACNQDNDCEGLLHAAS